MGELVRLGKTDVEVTPLGIGTWAWSCLNKARRIEAPVRGIPRAGVILLQLQTGSKLCTIVFERD